MTRAQALAQQIRDCNLDGPGICHLLGLARTAGLLVDTMWAIHGMGSARTVTFHDWSHVEKTLLRLDHNGRRIELRLEDRRGLHHLDRGGRTSVLYFLADSTKDDDTNRVTGRLPFLGAYLDDPDLAYQVMS